MKKIFIYDGSFEGFLTAIYQVFEEKAENVKIVKPRHYEPDMFANGEHIITDPSKALRVWKSLLLKATKIGAYEMYKTFLSEIKGVEMVLLRYIVHMYSSETYSFENYGNNDVLRVSQVAKMVSREKHRMEAFVRFKLTTNGIYFATISPDFNVLPLIAPHFTSRYADQPWIIYDLKRDYGLHYDLQKTQRIQLSTEADTENALEVPIHLHQEESAYQELWKTYFKNTHIASRKNMKLHMKHIPKRYWRHLTEKQPEA